MKLEPPPGASQGPDARKFVTGYLAGLGLNFFSLNWKVIGVEAWKFQRVITGDVSNSRPRRKADSTIMGLQLSQQYLIVGAVRVTHDPLVGWRTYDSEKV